MIVRLRESRKNDFDREIAIERYEDILAEARKENDRISALKAQSRIDALRGLDVQKVEHSGHMETTQKVDLTGLTDAELEILARRGSILGKPDPGAGTPPPGAPQA